MQYIDRHFKDIKQRLDKQFRRDFGCNGSIVWTTGTTASGDAFYAITATTNAVITYTETITGNTNTDVNLNAGVTIYGKFEDITVTSGDLVLYPV